MDAQDAINLTYLRATGKVATFDFASTKAIKILALLNHFQDKWSKATGVDWVSLYEPMHLLGTVTATDTFDLDTSSVRKISQQEDDSVRIIWPNDTGTVNNPNNFTDYQTVPADRIKGDFAQGHFCYRLGNNLVFNDVFDSTDPEFGGKIYVPCYTFVQPMVVTTDLISVDDPNWLCIRSAAEYVRTDVTRLGQFPNILNEANDIAQRMTDDNANAQNTDVTSDWNPSPYSASGIPWWGKDE